MNYKDILDEMQMALVNETLSRCIGDVDMIKEKCLPKNGKRRKRMGHFLQFILRDDHNVIEFEKMLTNHGLENLLKKDGIAKEEDKATQEFGRIFVHIHV